MIAVIFELEPHPGRAGDYFDRAAALAGLVTQADGFVSVERFESVTTPGKILSLSFFRDAASVDAWRCNPAHRDAQAEGRDQIFRDYRLRIARVTRDYAMNVRTQAPADSRIRHG